MNRLLTAAFAAIWILLAMPTLAAGDCSRGWAWSEAKGRCLKDRAYWDAKRGDRPCRARQAPAWGSCRADSPRLVPELLHGQQITLRDTIGTARGGMIGELHLVCVRGVLKDQRTDDGRRMRSCYRRGSAEDPAVAAAR